MMTETIETAASLRTTLSDAGLPIGVVETALRLTSPARRAQRVRTAMAAALYMDAETGREAEQLDDILGAIDRGAAMDALPRIGPGASDGEGMPGDCACARAAARCAVEAYIGTGGHMGAGGRSRGTSRESWADGLGSGRARASDGGAWDDALACAAARLSTAGGGGGLVTLGCSVYGGLRVTCGSACAAVSWSDEQEWAILLRGLGHVLPEGSQPGYDPLPSGSGICWEGTLRDWAGYLDAQGRTQAEAAIDRWHETPEAQRDPCARWEDIVGPRLAPWAHDAEQAWRDAHCRQAA